MGQYKQKHGNFLSPSETCSKDNKFQRNFIIKFTSAKPLLEQINAMTVYEMTLCFTYLCKDGNTPSIFKHIYTLKPINKYTTRSKNILFKQLCYYAYIYMQNFSYAIADHIYGINLLLRIMTC